MLYYLVWTVTIAFGLFFGNVLVFLFNLGYARYQDKKDKPLVEAYQKQLNAILDEARMARLGTLASSSGTMKTH